MTVAKERNPDPVIFDENLCVHFRKEDLPKYWSDDPAPFETKKIGSDWVYSNESAVLIVPSAIIESEFNFLLNPLHPDFKKIKTGKAERFKFDPRIVGKMVPGETK